VVGPEETAEAYLQAAADGRAEAASAITAPNATDASRALATAAVSQAAEDGPDRVEQGAVIYAGSAANEGTVDATIYQSGKAYPLELGLSEAGTQAMVFNDWDLQTGMVSGRALYATGPSQLPVNEVEIEVEPSGLGTTEDSSSPAYEGQNIDGW